MIESLSVVLPVIIYALLIILLVVGIILGIKLIITIDKVNEVVDDVTDKVNSLNGIFKIVDFASDKLTFLSEKVVNGVSSLINKLISSKNRKDEDDYE